MTKSMMSVKSQVSQKWKECTCPSKRPFSQFFTLPSSHPADSQLVSEFLISFKHSAPPDVRVQKKSWHSIKNLENSTLVSFKSLFLIFQVPAWLFWASYLAFCAFVSFKFKESILQELADTDVLLVPMLSHLTEEKTDCALWEFAQMQLNIITSSCSAWGSPQ